MRVWDVAGVCIDGGSEGASLTKVMGGRKQVCTAVGGQYGRRLSEKRERGRQRTRMRAARQERKKSEIDSCPQKHSIKLPTSGFSSFLR